MADTKVVCIGHPELHNFFRENFTEWDWQVPVEDVETFHTYLNDGTIDSDTKAIFIWDALFDPTGADNQFENTIGFYAPYAMIAILNYNKELNGRINEAISNAVSRNGWDIADWDVTPYEFIDNEDPFVSISEAVENTIRSHPNEEVSNAFSGGSPVVEFEDEEESVAVDENYQGPRSFIGNEEKLGKVVAVTSSKGGSGKSTIAISLASYIARSSELSKKEGLEDKKLKVAIVDLDIRDGQLGFLTGFYKPTVLSIVLKDEVSVQTVSETTIESDGLKCDLYLAPKNPRASEDTPPQFYNELIQTLRAMYDYIILDTSVNYLDPLLEEVAYPSADQIIFVTDLGVNSIFGMTRWIQEVTGAGVGSKSNGQGVNKNKIGIVVNKSLTDVGMDVEKIRKASMSLPVLSVLPSLPKLVTAAANNQSLELLTHNAEVNKALRRLSGAVVGKGYALSVVS